MKRVKNLMLISISALAIFVMTAVGSWSEEEAAAPLREVPLIVEKQKLDFSKVGIYGSFFDFCDLNLRKIIYFGDMKEEKRLSSGVVNGKINIPEIYPFDRVSHSRPISEYLANADAILSKLDLKNIYAIILNEENVTWNNGLAILNSLYDHIKSRYDVSVYQWLTPPNKAPHPKLRADGWVINPYGARKKVFRRRLMKHLVTGKPVINCIWASEAHHRFGDFEKMWPSSQEQVEVCKEFNIPMFFYCVDNKYKSASVWLNSNDPEIVKWREWFFKVLEEAHKIDTSKLPLPSANFSEGRKIEISRDEEGNYLYKEDFDSYKFIDDSTIEGFLSLRLDGARDVLQVVSSIFQAQPSLTYQFFSIYDIHNVKTILDINYLSEGSGCEVGFSKDGKNWAKEMRKKTGRWEINYATGATKNFWVKIIFPSSGEKDKLVAELNKLEIEAQVEIREQDKILLRPEKGVVKYTEDFTSQKYLHMAEKIVNSERLEWQPGRVFIRGKKGGATRSEIIYHFYTTEPINLTSVNFEGYAHKDLWGNVTLALSRDGIKWEKKASIEEQSAYKNKKRFSGIIEVKLEEEASYQNIQDLWIKFTLRAPNWTPTHHPASDIRSFTIKGKVSK